MSDHGSSGAGALSVYAYPWDVTGDPAALDVLTSMDADRVVLAAAYHSVRAATPRHPRHKVVDARWSAIYAPFRREAFAALPIAPRAPGGWVTEGAFARARRSIAEAGVDVAGWLALTHVDGESASDEFRVVNAVGDVYAYALCPSHDAVIEYASTVVRETVDAGELSSIVVEAWSQLGVAHVSQHDKTSAAGWTAADLQLLSICFCIACRRLYLAQGADVDALRAAVRASVGSARAQSVRDEWGAVVLAARTRSRRRMLSAILPAAHDAGAARVELHADDDPWATGPCGPIGTDDDVAAGVAAVVAPAWSPGAVAVERVRRLSQSHREVAAYVSALGTESAEALAMFWEEFLAAGAGSLHLYHFGLASADRIATAIAARAAIRERTH
jgi:hypothetical protein